LINFFRKIIAKATNKYLADEEFHIGNFSSIRNN